MSKKVITKHKNKPKNIFTGFVGSVKHHWPAVALAALSLLICFLNFDSGTFLTGWDNLHPEFNIQLDLKRTFFSVWQEYRGTGLLGGMAHSADLPRQILIYLLLAVNFPINTIRYITTFLPLVVGPIFLYYFLFNILSSTKLTHKNIKITAFLSGVYYLLNLNTLQTFFIPFETFTWFYGSLPILLHVFTNYLKKANISNLLWILFVSFLSGSAFYVETIFVVFGLCLFPFVAESIISNSKKLLVTTKGLIALTFTTIPQLYWLLPVAFFVKTNGLITTQNRINSISSAETYFRNLEYGTIKDLFLMKGYLFEYLDLGLNGKYDYLLSSWRNHLSSPLISILGYVLSTIVLLGIYYAIKEKIAWSKSFLAVLLISAFFLLGGGLLINNTIPFVGELFRSPFTKFSIPLALSYSYFFAIGIVFLLDIFAFLDTRHTYNLTLFTCTFLLIIYMSPAFSGNLISKSMRVAIPNEYFELFGYLDKQPSDMRIANLPQHTFWGWNYYSWPARRGGGYRGSGFLWYGIKQPILDRAFDVWEKTSEQYYEELSTALYSQNQNNFDQVINKYNVGYLFVDKNVIAPDTKADLGLNYLDSILKDNPQYTLEKTFGNSLLLYKNNDFVSQNYLSINSPSDIRDLRSEILHFPLRPNQNWHEKAGYLNTNITFTNASDDSQSTLLIPSLSETEKMLPYNVEYRKNLSSLSLRFTPIVPIFFLNKEQIDLDIKPQIVQIPISNVTKKLIANINSQYFPIELPSEVDSFDNYYPITQTYLPTNTNFDFGLYYGIPTEQLPLINSLANATPTQCYYEPKNNTIPRKIEKILSPRSVTLLGTDVVACLTTTLPPVNNDQLISVSYTYYSPTLTTANVNITNNTFDANNTSQPLDPSNTPKRAQLFTKPSKDNKQVNLILEASETKSIQEITYKDVYLSTHDPIFEATVSLNKIDTKNIDLKEGENNLQISLPVTKTQFDINQISASNALFPEDKNCDQFNKGDTVKIINKDHILYQSKDAIQCDFLNMRHFDHSLNYLIGVDAQKTKGLNLTTCLENHTTRRCDIYERLVDTNSTQYLIQSIINPLESPGYTLHLFNQSLGNRITENRLNSISIRPFPLSFLKNIYISNHADSLPTAKRADNAEISSTHPAEFLYTVSLPVNNADSLPTAKRADLAEISLYQTSSPYWKALILPEEYKNLNPWQLTLKILLNYRSLHQLEKINNNQWYNSWQLPEKCSQQSDICYLISVIYIPQYLEFFGFGILLIFIPILFTFALSKQIKTKK